MTKATGFGAGDSFTVVAAATLSAAGLDGTFIEEGRSIFGLFINGPNLDAMYSGLLSFGDATRHYFGDTPLWNVNLESGGDYLDWLSGQPLAPGLWSKIDNAYNSAVGMDRTSAAIGVRQLFGEYAAYANTALYSDLEQFRSSRKAQSNGFLNTFLFAAPQSGFVASGSANGSPAYDADACGRDAGSRIWAGGFGSWAKQNSRDNLAGYKYDSRGLSLGYELFPRMSCPPKLNWMFFIYPSRRCMRCRILRHGTVSTSITQSSKRKFAKKSSRLVILKLI